MKLPAGFRERARALGDAQGRAASELRRAMCSEYDCSSSTLSRWLRSLDVCAREREPVIRTGRVTEDELKAVWTLQFTSHTEDRGLLMPDERAIEIAIDNSLIRAGVLSLDTYRAWKLGRGINARRLALPEPHVELRSLGPNHVWQCDFSLARNWKVINNGGLKYDETAYKVKDLPINEARILRFVAVDHTSGSFFVRYAIGRGESTPIFLEALYMAMASKALSSGEDISDRMPFRGVPQILMFDRGSFSKAGATELMMERLGVRTIITMQPRAKGTVEKAMHMWECDFESSFRLQGIESVAALNDQALHRAAEWNANRAHTRHGRSRRAFWLQKINSTAESELREIRCTLAEFRRLAMTEPETRTVRGGLTISHNGKTYRVPDELRHEARVEVRFSVFAWPEITLAKCDAPGSPSYACSPVERDEAGFDVDAPVIGQSFKSHAATERSRAVEEAKVAVGQLGTLVARGDDLRKVAATAMRPRAVEVEMEPAAAALMPKAVARLKVREVLQREFSGAEREWFAGWPEQVSEADVDAAVAAFTAGGLRARVVEFGR